MNQPELLDIVGTKKGNNCFLCLLSRFEAQDRTHCRPHFLSSVVHPRNHVTIEIDATKGVIVENDARYRLDDH